MFFFKHTAIKQFYDGQTYKMCSFQSKHISLPLREERRLSVFENRVLRRVFGPEREEVTGEWRKLHNVELNNLYCSPNIDRVIKSRFWRIRMYYELNDLIKNANIVSFFTYTGCPRRNVKYFGRVFLMLNYTDITQNTYIQS